MAEVDTLTVPVPPLRGYDEYDDQEAVEHFRHQMRANKMLGRSGVLHVVVRVERGQRRHQEGQFIDRLDGRRET